MKYLHVGNNFSKKLNLLTSPVYESVNSMYLFFYILLFFKYNYCV